MENNQNVTNENEDPNLNKNEDQNAKQAKVISIKEKAITVLKKVNYKWAVPVFCLVIMNLYQWVRANKAETAHTVEIQTLKKNYASEIRSKLLDSSKKQLSMMMKSLVWAVRSSMIRKNNDEITQYFYELVQEEAVNEVLLVNNQQNIMVSTNKKNEKKAFQSLYPNTDLNVQKITFINNEGSFYLIAPILSLDQKVGNLFIEMNNSIPMAGSLFAISVTDTLAK